MKVFFGRVVEIFAHWYLLWRVEKRYLFGEVLDSVVGNGHLFHLASYQECH